ncbi:MAG: nitrilase-related carbon-nitrogen hydrolase [Rhodospirillaceae bacterium]|nr:nitrilase-related carbon-nitrogen hydrolase [Rhodospirillaceae bacterium]
MPVPSTLEIALNRRRMLHLAGLAAVAGGTATAQAARPVVRAPDAHATAAHATEGPALRRDTIAVAAIQTRVTPVDAGNPAPQVAANLAAMVEAIGRVQAQPLRKDLIAFSGLALQGWMPADRTGLRRAAIADDGPEIAVLAGRARAHDCYISFGALAVDADWPGEVLAVTYLLDPMGRIRAKDWAPFADPAAPVASIAAHLDRYAEMYGPAAVVPVHATEVGVIAQSPAVNMPELFRAFALKGADVLIRPLAHGLPTWDAPACAAHTRCFSVVTTPAAPADGESVYTRGGGTVIHGPAGETLAEAGSKWEQAVVATLPMARHRATRTPLTVGAALFLPTYQDHLADFA